MSGSDTLLEPGELGEGRSRGQRQHVRRRVEHLRVVEEDPQRDVLRVHALVSIVGVGLGGDHDPQPSSLRQQQTQPLRRAELGDPVQVGDEAFGTVFLRSGEERLERIAGGVGIAAQRVQVEGAEQVAVALEEPHHQLRVDRSGELGADEFP